MLTTVLRRSFIGLLAVLVAGLLVFQAAACPFCSQLGGRTLTGDVDQASMVVFGAMKNARLDPDGNFGQGQTDLHIEAVIKNHDFLGKKKIITLPRYVPKSPDGSASKWLIFCDIYKGKLDPYRGVPMKSSDIVKYLQGAVAVKDKDTPAKLRFFFDWLDNPEIEISNDAYKEFAKSDYKDFMVMAKKLPADRVAKWLKDPNTPSFRLGLYGSMLGHSGKAEHADLLRKLLDDPQKRVSSGIDGMLAGYVLLKPKEGWEYLRSILKDPKKEFLLRYAALRSLRFFWDSRTDVFTKKQIEEAACLLLDQSDIADLAIEDLRKRKCWSILDQLLNLFDKKSHDIPIIKRSIMRFALACQDSKPKAAAFVKKIRAKDPDWVKDVEALLKLEGSLN